MASLPLTSESRFTATRVHGRRLKTLRRVTRALDAQLLQPSFPSGETLSLLTTIQVSFRGVDASSHFLSLKAPL